jgi:hypothetical protein
VACVVNLRLGRSESASPVVQARRGQSADTSCLPESFWNVPGNAEFPQFFHVLCHLCALSCFRRPGGSTLRRRLRVVQRDCCAGPCLSCFDPVLLFAELFRVWMFVARTKVEVLSCSGTTLMEDLNLRCASQNIFGPQAAARSLQKCRGIRHEVYCVRTEMTRHAQA